MWFEMCELLELWCFFCTKLYFYVLAKVLNFIVDFVTKFFVLNSNLLAFLKGLNCM